MRQLFYWFLSGPCVLQWVLLLDDMVKAQILIGWSHRHMSNFSNMRLCDKYHFNVFLGPYVLVVPLSEGMMIFYSLIGPWWYVLEVSVGPFSIMAKDLTGQLIGRMAHKLMAFF